jgi:hypothetical protein
MGRAVIFKQEETSGHEPQPGLDTKTDRLTDRQSQCDFDFEKKTEEKRLCTGLLTAFVQGASNSGSVENFVRCCSSNLWKCYNYL